MRPLSGLELARLQACREFARRETTPAWLDEQQAEWASLARADQPSEWERFSLARPDGSLEPLGAERWLFHLLGLPHRAVHVGLVTPNGQVVLQRRSLKKRDYPGAWDMAVTGHVPQDSGGKEPSYLAGGRKEMSEELGLEEGRLGEFLDGSLAAIPGTFTIRTADDRRNPPMTDVEVIQLFAARLTAAGLAALAPDPAELAGVLLCPAEHARELAAGPEAAPGLRESLSRFLAWTERPGS